MTERSPLNTGRTPARNKRKQERSKENRELRADLHRQKLRGDANATQVHIDAISKRK